MRLSRLSSRNCGSIPSRDILTLFAVVAQLVEHVIGNDEVSGSIPDNGSNEVCDF